MSNFLTQQIGPLPGGAWLGVVGGGLAIGLLGRRKRTAAADAVPVKATTAQDQSSQGAVQYVSAGTGVTTMGTPKYATNEEWGSSAVAYLIGRGTLASRATNAISHVLYPDSSNPTSSEDSALYNMAAAGVGLPPSLPGQAYIPDPPAVGPPNPAPSMSDTLKSVAAIIGLPYSPTWESAINAAPRGVINGTVPAGMVPTWVDVNTGARVVSATGGPTLVYTGYQSADVPALTWTPSKGV